MDIEAIVGYGLTALFIGFVVYKTFFNKKDSSKVVDRDNKGGNNKRK